MPAFHIVVKLLMLRLLLASLSGLSCAAYDFGYHPSAEEFDSLLRETRTWTRDLLANERRRENYVPRYTYPEQAPPKSVLDFQLFSDDQEQQAQQPYVYESVAPLEPQPEQHVQSELTSSGGSNFPIFFTNPATGIVYAISEVGRNTKSQTWTGNGSDTDAIDIYVTKAQYDADLLALRQRYEKQCAAQSPSPSQSQSQSVLSTPSLKPPALGTARPQIIRLQKPPKKSTVSSSLNTAAGNNKLPPRPPPIMVATGTTSSISDQLLKLPTTTTTTKPRPRPRPRPRPTTGNTQKPKRNKRKKKKKTQKHRPGHKLTTTTTTGPQIVLGKRTTSRPGSIAAPPATQLEKPHMPLPTAALAAASSSDTIFSDQPIAISSGYIELPHRLRRRSVDALPSTSAGARPVSSGRPRPRPSGSSNGRRRPSTSGNSRKRPDTPSLPANPATGGSGYRVPHAVHLLHARHNGSEERAEREGRKHSAEGILDIFELLTGDDYEDTDDSYYEQEANEHIAINKHSSSSSSEKPTQEQNSSSAEEGADFGAMEEELPSIIKSTTSSSTTTTTTTPTSTTEPATELAFEEEQLQSETSEEKLSSNKNSMSKKRIRRRPPGPSSDDYYDDDDVDDEDVENDLDADSDSITDSGIGSFFRMIFYPVQVAMSRIFDGITGQADEDENVSPATTKPKYPSYTLYHSAHSHNSLSDDSYADEDEDEEDDDGGSLGSWFGSWFGLRRRTKKIGSTTAMPAAPLPLPTPAPTPAEPAGWLESWFGFGKTTTEASSEETDYDKWFAGWFDGTSKRRRKATTTTTTTTTTMPTPQVPILTIVEPLRNPQNWIGILAHHIVNATGGGVAGTTKKPLQEALVTGVSSTTSAKPELPRRISYDKYQIWRLKPQDEPQVRALEEFKMSDDGNKLQWLKGPSLRGLTDVLVPPKMLVDFQGTLNFEGIAHEVLIFDVGKAIAYERNKDDYLYTTPAATRRPTKQPPTPPPLTWNKYHEYDDILRYLEAMRMRHTQLVELIHIGRSFEGRPLIVVKIESKQMAAAASAAAAASHKRLKHKRRSGRANAVFIEAGAQGLAWIGPASATWMISELLRLMRTNKSDEEHEFVRNTTWYIMPVLNPDGYVYSHDYDRFWKKSRSQHVAKQPAGLLDSAMTWLQQKRHGDKICYGVDLDRNWLYQWGKRGSSKAPCNEFYAGPSPFSEPETKAVSDFLMDYRTQIKLYISLQAYGQVLSYPVKANSTFNSERMDDFLDVAMVGTDVLRKKSSKARYKVDSANDLIEQRSGCSDAFAAYEIGIPFSFTFQLADNGVHGYLLPSGAIETTARDAFEIVSGMLDYI
ncbi:uncharacterized protein Dvir_GJ18680 [Drosophila virilis]|uniref:Peptidase M14 domain-containing protein n=1 Tax=Drosophila virilis TaxID=7244 RepID=B4M2C3_DROVI|nr:uncharacterized protein Dvir_GJ18680 [Drosophila virilis]